MRRAQDSINPRTHPDVMVLSHEDDGVGEDLHPYWYARVIGMFHAEVQHLLSNGCRSATKKIQFLWVRWFGRDISYSAGWKAHRLFRIGFVPDDPLDSNDPTCASGAFGFIDPAEVIRGVHLIPAFAHGKTSELLSPSMVRPKDDDDEDWQYLYINM